jgi:Zn-dependent protease
MPNLGVVLHVLGGTGGRVVRSGACPLSRFERRSSETGLLHFAAWRFIGRMPLDYVEGLIWYFVFVYTTVIHEAGHAWAALRLGDDTAYHGGQVSLDPTPHIKREPFGMVIVPILSWFLNGGRWMIGWASAPYDPRWATRHPRRAAWMAMAGPGADLVLLLGAALLIHAGLRTGVFAIPDPENLRIAHIIEAQEGAKLWEFCATVLSITFSLQVILIPFNLLPLPPLDGSAFPLFFLGESACEKYQEVLSNPTMRLFGIIVAWQIYGRIFPDIFGFALRLLYPSSSL